MGKSKKRAARQKNTQEGSVSAEEEMKEQPRMTSDDVDVEMEDLDPEFEIYLMMKAQLIDCVSISQLGLMIGLKRSYRILLKKAARKSKWNFT